MTFDVAFGIRFILAALAAYRLALLVTKESGPFMMFERLRTWLGQKASGKRLGGFRWTMAELFSCPHCLGIWLCLLTGTAVVRPVPITDIILTYLAIAGLQSFLTGKVDGE
jgi:hypothetical protein